MKAWFRHTDWRLVRYHLRDLLELWLIYACKFALLVIAIYLGVSLALELAR